MQIHKHRPQSAIQYRRIYNALNFLNRTRKRIETIDLTLYEGRRKNSLQQWAGVTINTLMISRDRREKASGGGRRNPSHTFQEKSTKASRTRNITIWNGTISHGHYTIRIHSTGLVLVQKMFFVTQRGEDTPSARQPTRTAAGHELNWFCWRGRGEGRTGAFGSVLWKYFVSNARVMSASASA